MTETKQLIEFIKKHKGEVIQYGNEYAIQVYDGDVIQANISCNKDIPFVKMEQRMQGSISLFLESEDDKGIIDYGNECKLMEHEPIINLFNTFKYHTKVEDALIALLKLH